jgi:predicted enzyme related to lactoylglutathione lyase
VISTGQGDGIDGGLVPRQGPAPEETAPIHGYVNTIGVTDLDSSVATALNYGGTLALPKSPVPGVGWLAYCKDTEGNIFGMLQPDENAAAPE